MLGLLALDVNQVVPVRQLVDALWGESPPDSARRIVQAHVSRLRAALAEAGGTTARAALTRHGSGYLLAADPGQIDAHRFRSLTEDASLQRDDADKVRVLNEALALWKGPALADVVPDDLREELCGGLEEARLRAVEDLLDAELRLGRHLRLIDELSRLAAAHPNRPRITRSLILALHRSGRTADALHAFESLRQRMREELGLDPPKELSELHLAILRGERPSRPPPARPAHPSPAQLPAHVPGFVGRTGYLALMDRLVAGRGTQPDAPALCCVVTGGAGVGKTALAVHWSHLAAGTFPDGQLYVDLRGYSETPPVTPIEALTALLRGLGAPAAQIPADQGQAAAMYRSELASRRMIVILDNARSPGQVRPLLPGRSPSVMLITSRAWLTGLVASDGVERISLDPLTGAEALELLSGMIGAERVRREDFAASELVRLCSYLPLALRIAAANLLALPQAAIGEYVQEIGGEEGLASFQLSGDESAGVRGAFDLSYGTLEPAARRVFRLLGAMPSQDLSLRAVAAMNDAPAAQVSRILGQLVDAHLVERHEGIRFGQHDLLRRYALLRSRSEDSEADRHDATLRLLRWYLQGTDRAVRLFSPFALRHLPAVSGEGHPMEFAGTAEALAWLEAERPHMVAAVAQAAHADQAPALRAAIELSRRLHTFLYRRGHLSDDLRVNHAARAAARRSGDVAGEAWACIFLAASSSLQGVDEQALAWLDRADRLARRTGDGFLIAHCLSNQGDVWWRLGEPDRCGALLQEEIALRMKLNDRYGEAFCRLNLGEYFCEKGMHGRSRAYYEKSLASFRNVGDQYGEALALHGLASLAERVGRLVSAVQGYTDAAGLLRTIENRSALGYMLVDLGRVYRRQGKGDEAISCLNEGLRLCQDQGMRGREKEYLRELSVALTLFPTRQPERR